MKSKTAKVFITLGLLLIVVALFVVGNNIYDEYRANKSSIDAINKLTTLILEKKETPDYILNPNMDMPTVTVDGWDYIGVINIEGIDVVLPVIAEWSDEASYISPCRYYGSAYKDNMIIAAHNFPSHFGNIAELTEEDEIVFTDMAGNSFAYKPVALEIIGPTDVEGMITSEHDLTLFTCTLGGQKRITLRCDRIMKY